MASKKDSIFWSKIIATQYLIRHGFLKSLTLPMIIGQLSGTNKSDSPLSNYLVEIYTLIALHFVSAILVSDRRLRHALAFLPHIIALGLTAYFFYFYSLKQFDPQFKIRVVIHSFGTISIFSFIASLHTTNLVFRSILRRCSTYLTVFYFVFNAYTLWWSENQMKIFTHSISIVFIRLHALICFLVCGGFALEKFLSRSCQFALYFIAFQLTFDFLNFLFRQHSNVQFWLFIDFLIDDFALFCGYFYLYQFYRHQQIRMTKKTE